MVLTEKKRAKECRAYIEAVVRAVKILVIASGGAATYQRMVEAVSQAGASAVAAASKFRFTEQTPLGAETVLATAGILVRQKFIENMVG